MCKHTGMCLGLNNTQRYAKTLRVANKTMKFCLFFIFELKYY